MNSIQLNFDDVLKKMVGKEYKANSFAAVSYTHLSAAGVSTTGIVQMRVSDGVAHLLKRTACGKHREGACERNDACGGKATHVSYRECDCAA